MPESLYQKRDMETNLVDIKTSVFSGHSKLSFWCLTGEEHAKIYTLKRSPTQVIHKLVIGSYMMIG